MRRSVTGWAAVAACVAFGQAVPRCAATAELPRLVAEVSRYRAEGLPSPESPARQTELARQYGFFRDLDESVATPRIPWGKPLAGGPVRALILHSWLAGREVVELAQRLDLKYTHVALLRERDWPPLDRQGSNLFEPLESRLVESLKGDEPVIAFGSSPCPWPDLREPTRKALLEAVRSGKGLVCAGDPAPVAQEMGRDFAADPQADRELLKGIPPNLRGATVRAGQFGKGRVVFLGFPSEAEKNCLLFSPTGGGLTVLNDPQREAACALLAQSLLWAGRREIRASVSLPENLAFKSEQMPGGPVSAEISGPGVEWMDWYVQPAGDAPPVAEGREHLPAKVTRAEFNLPHLPAGQYVIHAILRDAERASLAWTSAALTVTCDDRLEVKFDKPQYTPGDSAAVTVELAGAAPQPDLSLQCLLTDAAGRIMAIETRPPAAEPGANKTVFRFPMVLAVARIAVARATLFHGDRALVRAETSALVRLPREINSGVGLFSSNGHTAMPLRRDGYFLYYIPGGDSFREAAEQIGMPAIVAPGDVAARLDLCAWRRCAMPELETEQTVPLDQLVRKPCLADPDYVARCQEWIRGQARDMALTGELGLFVADAWNYAGRGAQVTNLCHGPASEQAFRDQARAEYRTLDALNAEWGSHYSSWDKITAPHWEQACESGNFCDWIDKRRSEESLVADFFKKCAAAGKEVYPAFRLALSGALNPSDVNGYDWRKLMGGVDVVSLGEGSPAQLARSFAEPWQLLLRAEDENPSEADPTREARGTWDALFSGLDGVIAADSKHSTLFWPDLSLRPNGLAVARAVRALRTGPADLLVGGLGRASRENDGVAILYSQTSLHAAAAEGMRGRPVGDETYVRSLAGCEALLGDLGLQFSYVADDEVAADALRARGCRLLVMPFSLALSPEELAHIRSFLMAGGAVLADLCPGVTDAHGKAYGFSQMDELLGLKRLYHRPLYRLGRLVVQPQPQYLLSGMEFDAVLGEPSVRLNGAVAWAAFDGEGGARAPAATFYHMGAGLSMLLNFSLADYRAAEEPASSGARAGRAEATQKLVRTFLAAARIQPAVSIRADPPADSGLGVRFRSGEAVYLGLSAPPGGRRKVSISLTGLEPSKRCVYDVRSHQYLGRAESLDYTMKDSCGELLALMPREIGDVRLRAPQRAERGRLAPVSVTLSGWKADLGRTVFRVELYEPDGDLNAQYTRTVACDGGRAELAIPFALNDASGEWLVRAIEVVSGHSGEARVSVFGG